MKNHYTSKLKTLLLCSAASFALSTAAAKEKPTVNLGVLLHTYVSAEQNGFGSNDYSSLGSSSDNWSFGANLYRGRILLESKLTENDYIFVETEISASAGTNGDKSASIKLLDAQYDRTVASWLTISAGKILVSYNRNGLQTAATLMANDFTYFQYAYNMSSDSPLQNDLGRDIGINFSGSLLNEGKLNYRFGVFAGRRDYDDVESDQSKPLRYVGRVWYNFFDKDLYSGTNLGEGKTLTVAAGFDKQSTYYAIGVDTYLDMPLGSTGSITANVAYSYMTGGDVNSTYAYSFNSLIPEQTVSFAELGYYFKKSKLQPWVRFEMQDADYKLNTPTTTVLGAGLNYFFNGYGTNVRASYVAMNKDFGNGVEKCYGQFWLQLQLFIF